MKWSSHLRLWQKRTLPNCFDKAWHLHFFVSSMDLILTVIIALKLQKENIEIHEVTRFGGRVRLLGPVHTYPDIFEAAIFLSGYGYRPHASGEFASKSGNSWIRSPEWKFFNQITFRIRVDGRTRICSDMMTSQNWPQYLPCKFKYGCRSKENSFCAPWAYFQCFSLYAIKCRSTKCWNQLCQKAA